jgi:hypothetical protein
MPYEDTVERVRRELAGLSGPLRCRPLLELGRALADRYWRTGPGKPAGLPDLSAAIDAMDEAYGYLELGDPARGHVASGLGWLLAVRHMTHDGPVRPPGHRVLRGGAAFRCAAGGEERCRPRRRLLPPGTRHRRR